MKKQANPPKKLKTGLFLIPRAKASRRLSIIKTVRRQLSAY
jgi:hypothetical protein